MGQNSGNADALQGFDETVPTTGRNYILPGKGRVRIEKLKYKKASEAFSGKDTFIAELTTISHEPAAAGGERMQVGDTRSYVVVYDKRYPTMFHSDIKKFLGAADGTDPVAVTKQTLDFALSDQNPLGGVEVDFYAKMSKTENGGDFTKIEFKAVPDPVPASA